MSEDLTSKTLRGLKWSYFSTVTNAILQVGVMAVMARLLDPRDFGVVAMAGVVLRFGGYFSQMGVGSAVVQKLDLTDEEVKVGFTSSIIFGVCFFAAFAIGAPAATLIFPQEDVVPVVRALALTFLIGGASVTSLSLLRRRLDFRSLALVDIVSYSIGYGVVGVVLALSHFGVWSLEVASLSQALLTLLLAYNAVRHPLRFRMIRQHFRGLYGFGARVTTVSFLEFITSNLDTMAIGHYLSAAAVGMYNRASMAVNLPAQYFTTSFSRVMMPAFSQRQATPERLKDSFLISFMVLGMVLLPACFGVAGAANEVILLLLGPKWVEAVPLLQVLSIGVPAMLLGHIIAVLCEATARLTIKIVLQVSLLVVLVILFAALKGFGLIGFAASVTTGAVVTFASYLLIVRTMLKVRPEELWRVAFIPLVSGVGVGMLTFSVSTLLNQAPLAVSFISEVLGSLVLLWVILRTLGPLPHADELRVLLASAGVGPVPNRVVEYVLALVLGHPPSEDRRSRWPHSSL